MPFISLCGGADRGLLYNGLEFTDPIATGHVAA